MPPAFNLSQDQTLQFNLCTRLHSTDVNQSKTSPLHSKSPPSPQNNDFLPWLRARQLAPPGPLPSVRVLLGFLSSPQARSIQHQFPSTLYHPPRAPSTPSTHTYRLSTLLKSVCGRKYTRKEARLYNEMDVGQ